MTIILASSSIYRRELFARLQLPFTTDSPNVDESPHPNESPRALVERLALMKATAVADRHSDAIVIGADQIAVHLGKILGKPGNREQAEKQLARLSGQRVTYLSGIAVVSPDVGYRVASHACELTYRHLDVEEIDTYLTLEQPFDCAGSLKAEGLGITLLDELVSDDPTSIIGLPLITLVRMMRDVGVNPLSREHRAGST